MPQCYMASKRDKSLDIIKTLVFFDFITRNLIKPFCFLIGLFFYSNNNYSPKTIP